MSGGRALQPSRPKQYTAAIHKRGALSSSIERCAAPFGLAECAAPLVRKPEEEALLDVLRQPWPWWLTGIGIGLVVPALLLIGNRSFGVSSNLRHLCAAICPADIAFFRYDWKRDGLWNLVFALGILIGGYIGGVLLGNPEPIAIAPRTKEALAALGLTDFSGLAPRELFTWSALGSLPGFLLIVVGGFLVGFGTAYGGGCTSGHGISGLANFQLPSLIAVIGFFVGGLIATHVLLPLVL